MDILFLGHSSLVQRKALPAAMKTSDIGKIHLASSRPANLKNITPSKRGHVFNSYEKSLTSLDPCLVYVSLPNSLHYTWVKTALENNHHVIVDKPAFLTLDEYRSAATLALNKNLCLAEANVWLYHPQVQTLIDRLKINSSPHNVYIVFSSPPLNKTNFRYNPDLGGGILLDRVSYLASCSRILFGSEPIEILSIKSNPEPGTSVDITMGFLLAYPNGRFLNGFFSLGSEYKNSLQIIGENYFFELDRVFTPPADKPVEIKCISSNNPENIHLDPADTFQLFIEDVLSSIRNNEITKFEKALSADMILLSTILRQTKEVRLL